MTLREMVVADYQERVALCSVPEDLKRSLKAHERVPQFVDNLVNEINRFPTKIKVDRVKLKYLVHQMTDIFILAVKTTAENKFKSEIEKNAILKLAEEPAFLDKDGNGTDPDTGITIKDSNG